VKVLDKSPRLVRFEGFQLDQRAGELRPDAGKTLRLSEQPFRILIMLLERPSEVLTREEIRKELWPDDTIVEFEHSINAAMNRLRQALGDSADHPHYIETLARRGYRWMVSVDRMEVGPPSDVTTRRWKWLPLAAALLLGIGLIAGVLKLVLSSPKPSAPALTSVPLTALPGRECEPSFSPDGNEVAFTRSEEGDESKSHIYVKLIGTSGPPLQLTKGPAEDIGPVWSPDGRYIAFLRQLSQEKFAVLLIPALGGPERKIAEVRLAGVWAPFLAWSPDGKFLVVSHKDSPKEPAALFVVAIDTGEKRRLTSPPSAVSAVSGDSNPAFSPDGRTLAFIRISDLRTELYLLPISGALQPVGEARLIPLLKGWAPAWTEDGHEIVFLSPGQGLWRVGVSGSDTRSAELARLPFGDSAEGPAISRRGHRLAYSNQSSRNSSIWRMAAPTGASARDGKIVGSFNRSFISSTQRDGAPQFSPDGKRIAFVSERSGELEIWVCNSDGSSPLQLTSLHGVTTPRWSPDGRRIAFDSDAAGEYDVWVIGADGGKPVRMTPDPANDGDPSWSHDGRWIYFDSMRTGEQQLWKMPANGGEAIQLTWDGGATPLESPDGKFLYYTKNTPGVWRVPVDGGQRTKILEGLSSYLNLAIVDKGIYFVPDSGSSIQFLDLRTNQIRRVASFERPVGSGDLGDDSGLAISPDGRWILYSRVDQGGAELRLVENFH
jgi:Tol biopolymer transport system component/DNA-binding winged helix-turn-helix (wHTH) protein